MRYPLAVVDDAGLAALDDRLHDHRESRHRLEPARDRDRVLYSSAFQRLGHVTQVTASETGLSFHSRLTHSLKVAQFARRLAERLAGLEYTGPAARVIEAMSPDAAEAAALAHDLGHPPFGHLAESALNDVTKDIGGFEGNAQSFRILTRLSLRWFDYEGIDLARRTLNGVCKYPWKRDLADPRKSEKWNAYEDDVAAFDWVRLHTPGEGRTVEAEIMDWADDVTYAVHDMDDFYRAGLLPMDRLCNDAPELARFQTHLEDRGGTDGKAWAETAELMFKHVLPFTTPYAGGVEDRVLLRMVGSGLITRFIDGPAIENDGAGANFSVDDALRHQVDVLKQLMWFYVIERPSLAILQTGQRAIIEGLFEKYEAEARKGRTRVFPPLIAERLETAQTEDGKRRVVVDYIASLTEDGAATIYRRMTGTAGGSIVDPAGRLL